MKLKRNYEVIVSQQRKRLI